MLVRSDLKREERDRLQDLITYFGSRVPHLQMVKVDKMVYIAQLYHYSAYGELITGVPFISLSRGPHAPDIRSIMEELLARNIIYIEQNRSEIESANPCLLIKCDDTGTGHLPDRCLNTLQNVIEDWGQKKFGKVLDYLTRTVPFLSTPYKEPIDFRKSPPSHQVKEVLPLSRRTHIHRFIHSPGEVVWNKNDSARDAAGVSLIEVAEIYLCLCGTVPQGIVSREHLGFDIRTVSAALAVPDEIGVQGSGREDTDLDLSRAARLTESLAHARCFNHENEKVAFWAGMFFLKKRGYPLDKGFQEGIFPKLYEYEAIKAYFGGISGTV
jgi:hypothetical protein